MDIRGNEKDINKLKKIKTEVKDINFNIENELKIPIIMIQDQNGSLIEWTRGYKNVLSFLKYGYVRIIKKCPLRHRKCIGEKCSFYHIENGTGDCAIIWNLFKK